MKSLEFDHLLSSNHFPADRYDFLCQQSPHQRVYVQEKKNGVGLRIEIKHGQPPIIRTRNGKVYPPAYFADIDFSPLYELSDAIFHVELYSILRTLPLATLAGGVSVNRLAPDPEILKDCGFYIYDYEEPDGTAVPFSRRIKNLESIYRLYFRPFEVARTIIEDTGEGLIRHWNKWMYTADPPPEGFVYRVDPCFHHAGSPTFMQVKRTRIHTMEGTCIDVEEGLGKRVGMLGSFRLQLDSGHIVSVGGGEGLTDEELTRYFKQPPIGKKITFSYKELSKAGCPLRVQFVTVRDYE